MYLMVFFAVFCLVAWRWSEKFQKAVWIFLVAFCASKVWGVWHVINNQNSDQETAQGSDSQPFDFDSYLGGQPFQVKRNIYQILVDSYPSLDGMKRFQIDNSQFYQDLEEQGFQTWRSAFSNYPNTSTSMNALWTMKLFPMLASGAFYGGNEVFARLIAQGYVVYCGYPCFDDSHSPNPPLSPKILKMGELEEDLFPQYYFKYYLGTTITHWIWGNSEVLDRSIVNTYWNFLQAGKKPALLYIHYNSPIARYPHRLEKLNQTLLTTIRYINKNDPDAIIVLSSDHGNRQDWIEVPFTDTPLDNFGILLSVKFPKECSQLQGVKRLTPVNIYRYVFACLENQPVPENLEPDHSYMWGKTWAYAWDSSKDRTIYQYLENGKILDTPKPTDNKL